MPTIALITGASRGIGRATALKLASQGCHTILVCRNSKEALERLKIKIESTYDVPCNIFVGDIGDAATVSNLFSSLSSLDILVNNAGISYFGLLQDMTTAEWEDVLRINLTSCFLTSKYAIPLMLKQGRGKIINISSVWGNVGAAMEVAYSASKGGMNAFTRALAKELAPSSIQVNGIACGVIETNMNSHLSLEYKKSLQEEIPADRFGSPQEVAELVWQLATGPNYLTGQIIALDGGWI